VQGGSQGRRPEAAEIDEVVLVGGMTRMPKVQEV
jgi:molecular chaperone DnaK (HSP70)